MEASSRPQLERGSRRRPSGQPPPLPHHLQGSGAGWLIAAIALTAASIVIFARGLQGPAVGVTVADDAVTRWLATARVPGVTPIARGLAEAGSVPVTTAIAYGLVAPLLVLRRFRHLLVFVASIEAANVLSGAMQQMVQRPRPFGVPIRFGWGGFALPSVQIVYLCAVAVGVLYALVPAGRWRQAGERIAAGLVALVALARVRLGVDAPTDVLVGAAIGVTIPLLAFRWFTPDECFPIAYRRGRSAHLDLGGARGGAIRSAMTDQLGLVVTEVQPFGLAGSRGSTPMRLRCEGGPGTYLFGKLYARSHLRADRWYKLGRELLYGRLEDEKPFSGVRRLVQQEDYALRLMRDAGLPTPAPHGFAELTPEREYVLVTEFFTDAVELGQADVDDGVIDESLAIIRRLWHAGLAHRDIKPANLLVRDGHVLLIDVAFAQARPSPWRQAVDLANMMLCLALRTPPQRVYQRALRQFTTAEISEAFAAAQGLALPSQLRHALRTAGRDIHEEFLRLLPERPRPIRIQRWSIRRAALWAQRGALYLPPDRQRSRPGPRELHRGHRTSRRQPGLPVPGRAVGGGAVGALSRPAALCPPAPGGLGRRPRQCRERPLGHHPRQRPRRDRCASAHPYGPLPDRRCHPGAFPSPRSPPIRRPPGGRWQFATVLVRPLPWRLRHHPAPLTKQAGRHRLRAAPSGDAHPRLHPTAILAARAAAAVRRPAAPDLTGARNAPRCPAVRPKVPAARFPAGAGV